ncbi:PorP/SprF family type IX secretion system membrane protein [Bizionia myxarmorum]|uniref:Type IX secretion system membrane protein PorP/SprF n=1 Tax=Bizionia myxarmorum TaxID=291186 RepID=A0A5D0RFN1_9FLAO|nr:type IX secretion system membrane protein PorP/SprF [Bizionia myxarmorum]TYB79869.1 type IX secretion system membrane protein PorP/SprF [Bizionia myxarmorum]
MKRFKQNIIALALFSCTVGVAQQLPQFTQYMYNTISINPAYAGSRETLSVVGLHRSQWVGFDGGPITQTLSVHTPLRNEKIGLGMSFINDKLGDERFTYVYGDFSYTIQTGQKTELAFGVKAGFTSYNLDRFAADASGNDPGIYGIDDRWDPNIGAGLYWHSDKWYLGLSAPRILTNDYNDESGTSQDYAALERVSYYFTGGYVFSLSENTKLKPAALLKATNGAPLSFDITANFLFYEKFWIGGGYRIDNQTSAIAGIADFQVSPQFRIGYAYEYPISDLNAYTGGTHEIMVMFELFRTKRIKSPRYF